MAMTRACKQELLELLEALCEERLTAADAVRLEEIVLAHRSARRVYLDYVHLHGTLLWDAAQGDDGPSTLAMPVDRIHSPVAVGESIRLFTRVGARARLVGVVSAVCLAALAVIVFWDGPENHDAVPIANNGDTDDAPAPVENVAHEPRPFYRPIELSGGEREQSTQRVPVVALRPEGLVRMPKDLVAYIDDQIAATWKAAGVQPSERASEAAWLRRVYLDLSGRIPAPETVTQFLKDERSGKREAVVEELLASDNFSRHFATVWTNLLVGRSDAMARPANRDALYRFLEGCFAKNRPWDNTVAQMISAEGSIDQHPAGNFLVANLNNQAVPATALTARIFLGTRIQCMQCHNHPFNDWTQRDFWQFKAFFKQTKLTRNEDKVPTLVSKSVGGATMFETRQGVMNAAYPIFEGEEISDDATVNRRKKLAKLMARGEKPQLAEAFVNRLWAQLLGAGFTNPIDDMGPHNPPTHPEVLDRLSRAFVDSGYDVRQLVRWITATEAYQLSSRFNETNKMDHPAIGTAPLFSRAYPKTMTVEQAYNSLLVATRVDPSSVSSRRKRDQWVMQFVETYQTDENNESVQFSGSIPAALAMMNGQLTAAGLEVQPGTRLHAILADSRQPGEVLKRLALATLNRPLTERETETMTRLVRRQVFSVPPAKRPEARVRAYQDLLWVLLNSAEFLIVP